MRVAHRLLDVRRFACETRTAQSQSVIDAAAAADLVPLVNASPAGATRPDPQARSERAQTGEPNERMMLAELCD